MSSISDVVAEGTVNDAPAGPVEPTLTVLAHGAPGHILTVIYRWSCSAERLPTTIGYAPTHPTGSIKRNTFADAGNDFPGAMSTGMFVE